MGGQHRWAPAFLAACHHIYFTLSSTMYISSLANKIVVVVIVYGREPLRYRLHDTETQLLTCDGDIVELGHSCIARTDINFTDFV